jgi:hypothetical protein
VPINSVTEGVKLGNKICKCWRKTDDFDQCLVDAGKEDQIRLGGVEVDIDMDYGEPTGMGSTAQHMKFRRRLGPRKSLLGKITNDWVSCRRVGKLTAAKKKKLPNKAFGLPETRSYPMPDPSHAKNAKSRAKQQLKKKKLTKADYNRIVRKADRVINKCKRGR